MDAKYLEEIKAREQAATPGPWTYWHKGMDFNGTVDFTVGDAVVIQESNQHNIGPIFRKEDAAFIAAARTDIPALIAEVERLTEENKKLHESRDYLQELYDKLNERDKNLGKQISTLGDMVNSYSEAKEKAESDFNEISALQERTSAENTTLKKALNEANKKLHSACAGILAKRKLEELASQYQHDYRSDKEREADKEYERLNKFIQQAQEQEGQK
jgi:chromosome segregation ATPase